MLDLPAFVATLVLLFYAVYAAWFLVPKQHPLEALMLNMLACLVGLIGASPWADRLPDAEWPSQLLIITLAVVITVWRREASTFVRCRFGAGEGEHHPHRRSSDFAPLDEAHYPHVNGGKQ